CRSVAVRGVGTCLVTPGARCVSDRWWCAELARAWRGGVCSCVPDPCPCAELARAWRGGVCSCVPDRSPLVSTTADRLGWVVHNVATVRDRARSSPPASPV